MNPIYRFEKGPLIYQNSLSKESDLADFIPEGKVVTAFDDQALILKHDKAIDEGHWVYWNRQIFQDEIVIEWSFRPLSEPGLCMLFFAASGQDDKDLFDASLPERTGAYPSYHSGAINTLHLSYFRRRWPEERAFHTCNLRKSAGFHLVAQGADPIPSVEDCAGYYHLKVIYYHGIVQFSVNNMVILEWKDDGDETGTVLKEGRIGFRQMSPMEAAYSNLQVSKAVLVSEIKEDIK